MKLVFMMLPEVTATAILVVALSYEIFFRRGSKNDDSRLKACGNDETKMTAPWILSFLLLSVSLVSLSQSGTAFSGMFIADFLSQFFKLLFSAVLLFLTPLCFEYFKNRAEKTEGFFLILWTAVIGLFFLVSSNHLLVLFISLEVVTLAAYILTSYLKNEKSSIEAGMKYLILGSLASAFLLYGMSLIYVACGTIQFDAIRDSFTNAGADLRLPAKLGFLLMLAGLGFKIAAAPFQWWVPDVYEGAPTPVTAYLAAVSKASGFAVLLRLIFTVFPSLENESLIIFSWLAALTLIYGNLGALLQTNIKRLLAYSSIGHAGYLLIGLVSGDLPGVAAILYYLPAYAAATLASFYVVTLMERETGSSHLEAYRGLAKRSPFLAGSLFLALLSLAGVPPLAGFFAKFLILLAAVNDNLIFLALLGSLAVAVSLYYYLQVVRKMYLEESVVREPASPARGEIKVSTSAKIQLSLLLALILILGIFQSPLYSAASRAAQSLF